jgi:hypothetical protein
VSRNPKAIGPFTGGTAKRCMISRIYRPPASCIFHSISIRNSLQEYERLAAIFTGSSHLGAYVRFLSLEIECLPPQSTFLVSILSHATRVERLVIDDLVLEDIGTRVLTQQPSLIDFLSSHPLACVALPKFSDVPSSILTRRLLETC